MVRQKCSGIRRSYLALISFSNIIKYPHLSYIHYNIASYDVFSLNIEHDCKSHVYYFYQPELIEFQYMMNQNLLHVKSLIAYI